MGQSRSAIHTGVLQVVRHDDGATSQHPPAGRVVCPENAVSFLTCLPHAAWVHSVEFDSCVLENTRECRRIYDL